jgi:hypothetical protein
LALIKLHAGPSTGQHLERNRHHQVAWSQNKRGDARCLVIVTMGRYAKVDETGKVRVWIGKKFLPP